MTQPADDRGIRDRIYEACWQDGSIDLFAGAALAGVGIAWLLDAVALGALAPAVAVPLWAAFRRGVVEPRLGSVRFDAPRRRHLRRGQLTLLLLGSAALLVAVAGWWLARGTRPDWARDLAPALPGALVGLGAVVAALSLSLPRLAWHGAGFVVAGLLAAALAVDPGWSLLAGGLASAVAGGVLFVRFLRAFPRLSNELS